MPTTDLSLYDITEDVQALLDTEALVTDEQREQFEAELMEAMKRSTDKCEGYGRFRAALEAAAKASDEEVERLQKRAAAFRAVLDRVDRCLLRVLESMPINTDRHGKEIPRRLEARTFTFSAYQKPAHVEITDEAVVPREFKTVKACLNAEDWDEIWNLVHDTSEGLALVMENVQSTSVRLRDIAAAIKAGEEIPGADLKFGGYRLGVK